MTTVMNFVQKFKEAELADSLAENTREEAWSGLAIEAATYSDPELFIEGMKTFEDEYMREWYSDKDGNPIPEAVKKNGEWKYRKFKYKKEGKEVFGGLPPAYVSAKSTCKQALLHGIPLTDEKGFARKKTPVSEEYAKVKKGMSVPKSKYERALNAAGVLAAVWDDLDDEERSRIRLDLYFI